jgi:hypothetical protein
MSASLRELQRVAARGSLKILRYPPVYYVVEDHEYDALKRTQRLELDAVRQVAIFKSEHFLEVRGFIKGYKR